MPPRTGRAGSWAALAALPSAAGAVCVLLLCGAFSSAHPAPWALLAAAVLGAVARWGLSKQRRPWYALEEGFVCALAVLALTQLAQPLQPLMYLLAAAYVLALPLRCAIPLLAALIALDAALTVPWPQMAAHASFAVLFAALYHALLGARLAAARRAEGLAVRKRIADAEARARELRLVAVSSEGPDDAERHLLGGVSEVEEVLRGALAVAEAALRPHTVAVFLLSPDGESVRLRECASLSERLFRGPLSSRAGAADVRRARSLRDHAGRGSPPSRGGGGGRGRVAAARPLLRRECRPGQQRRQARRAAPWPRARRDGSGPDLRRGDGRARSCGAEDLSAQVGRERGRDAGVRLAQSGRASGSGAERAGDAGAAGRRGAGAHASVRAGRAARHHRRAHRAAQPEDLQCAASWPAARGRALPAAALAGADRHRSLPAGERRLRPSGGRRRAAQRGGSADEAGARDGHRRPVWRRGDDAHPSRDRRARSPRHRRAHPQVGGRGAPSQRAGKSAGDDQRRPLHLARPKGEQPGGARGRRPSG